MMMWEQGGRRSAGIPDDSGGSGGLPAVPASIVAYVATRCDDVTRAIAILVDGCARTALWSPVTRRLQASAGMAPCRFGASLVLRRVEGSVAAAIVAPSWSVTLNGDEALLDVVLPSNALMASLEGALVTAQTDIPFLPPTMRIRGSTAMGGFQRLTCY